MVKKHPKWKWLILLLWVVYISRRTLFLNNFYRLLALAGFQNANPLQEPVCGTTQEALANYKDATPLNLRDYHLFHVSDSIKKTGRTKYGM